jgi:hypothetical protein
MLAVLFTYVPATGQNFATPIEHVADPIGAAHALKDSCFDDFPGALWSVTGDAEAIEARGKATMKRLLGEDKEG